MERFKEILDSKVTVKESVWMYLLGDGYLSRAFPTREDAESYRNIRYQKDNEAGLLKGPFEYKLAKAE